MTADTQQDTYRFTGDYVAAVATMVRAMSEMGGSIKRQQPESGLIEAAWRYGLNPWGLLVTAQFRDEGGGALAVTVRGGFKDSFSTVSAPHEKASAVLARFAELMAHQAAARVPADGALTAPRLGDGTTVHRGKSKTTTALLALILGGLGAHRFYLGSWGIGLLYLALLLVPGLGLLPALVEAVRFFAMSSTRFDDRYNLRPVHAFAL
jgi:TM2 domain-containing membrane protein YozV